MFSMDMSTNRSLLHSDTVISGNSNQKKCIVKTEDNTNIKNNEEAFLLENIQNSFKNINSTQMENVEKCDNQNDVYNTTESYSSENLNQAFPLDGYCIEIPEELCNTQTMDATIESNQLNQSFQCQDFSFLNSNRHVCDICNRAFGKKSNLNRHYRIHTGDNPYNCDICNSKYPNSSSLREHQKTHSGEKPFYCSLCDKTFARSANLVRHLRTHTGEKPYQCHQCDSCFADITRLKEHCMIHTGEKQHACDICDKKFLKKSNLKRHYLTHTGDTPTHPCEICGRNFSKRIYLLVHIKAHSKEALSSGALAPNDSHKDLEKNQSNVGISSVAVKNEVLEESTIMKCGTDTENTHSLEALSSGSLAPNNSHKDMEKNQSNVGISSVAVKNEVLEESTIMKYGTDIENTHSIEAFSSSVLAPNNPHKDIEKNQSDVGISSEVLSEESTVMKCGTDVENTLNNSEVSFETYTFKNFDDKLYSCKQCGKYFIREKTLNAHLQTHCVIDKNPIKCSVCKASFPHMSRLKEHLITHSDEKRFYCVVCGQKFGRKYNLMRHLLTHSGEKMYQCDICNNKYSSMRRLKEHRLNHTKINVHQCDVCKKLFRHKCGLERHYLIHTEEKPHKCDLCDKQFSRISNLHAHYQSHGKILPASQPPNHSDNVTVIQNRVEPRLTQIIENLESRVCELPSNSKKSAPSQKKLLVSKKSKTNSVKPICAKEITEMSEN